LAGLETILNGDLGSIAPYALGSKFSSDYLWHTLDPERGSIQTDTVTQTMHVIQAGWSQSYYADSWDLYLEYNRTWKALDYPLVAQTITQDENTLEGS
jgi:hypothetical protein